MKKIVAFFRRWYYRRIFFKLYYNSVFKQGKDAEYAVWDAAEAVDSISYYLTGKKLSHLEEGSSDEQKDKSME